MNYRQRVGRYGEQLSQDYLRRHGYSIIDFNVKTSYQELDIIAKSGEMIVFVEVKTRTNQSYGEAENAVGHKKIINLKRAISQYLQTANPGCNLFRLDLIVVDINKLTKIAKIKHYFDIF